MLFIMSRTALAANFFLSDEGMSAPMSADSDIRIGFSYTRRHHV